MRSTTQAQTRNRRNLDTVERTRTALELYGQRASYADIGQALGCSKTQAYRLVQAGLLAIIQEPAENVRAQELAKLEALEHVALGLLSSDPGAGIDRFLRILERRAKLLGLDAPTRIDVSRDAVEAEIARLEAYMAGALTRG